MKTTKAKLEEQAKIIHENAVVVCQRQHMALSRNRRYGEGYTIPGTVASFIRATADQHDWHVTKEDVELLRKYLRASGNIVVLGQIADFMYRIFVRSEWRDSAFVTVPVPTRQPDAIDYRAERLRPEEVGEDREPAPVEVITPDKANEPKDTGVSKSSDEQVYPLSEQQAFMLARLSTLPGGEVVDLRAGRATGLLWELAELDEPSSSGAKSTTIAHLERRGLVVRTKNAKRTQRIRITHEGSKLVKDLARYRATREVVADLLVERGGTFTWPKPREFTNELANQVKARQTATKDALRSLESDGLIEVERMSQYPQTIKWVGGDREPLSKRYVRWLTDAVRDENVTVPGAQFTTEPAKVTGPLLPSKPRDGTTTLHKSHPDGALPQRVPRSEYETHVLDLTSDRDMRDFMDALRRLQRQAIKFKEGDEAATIVALVKDVLHDVSEGKTTPLKALGDIEVVVSEFKEQQ